MSDLPFMKLFWPEFLADTSHLGADELGLYVRILGRMWLSPDGYITEEMLKRLCHQASLKPGLTETDSEDLWLWNKATVCELLECCDDGKWTQKRLLAEHKSARETRAKLSEAGRKGGSSQVKARPKPRLSRASQQEAREQKKEKEATSEEPAPPPRMIDRALEVSSAQFRKKVIAELNQQPKTNSLARGGAESLGAILGVGESLRPTTGPDYDNPIVRKARWRQKLHNFMVHTCGLEVSAATTLWEGYEVGDPAAKDAIERWAADMKAEEEAIRAQTTSSPTSPRTAS